MKKGLAAAGALIAIAIATLLIAGYFRSPEIAANAAIEIDRPAQQVWDFLSTPENLPKWSGEVNSVVRTAPDRYQIEGSGGTSEMQMVTVEPPRRYISRMGSPQMGYSGEWDIRVEPVTGQSARVTSRARITMHNWIFRALSILVDANSAELDTLVQLKRYLESQPAS